MRRLVAILAFCALVVLAAPGQVFTTITTFSGNTNGGGPNSPLIQGKDGNFYGTMAQVSNDGAVFKVTPAGVVSVLYTFCRQFSCQDGLSPRASLIQATDGNFYGTTYFGGSYGAFNGGNGTVFRITPGGTFTSLHSFNGKDGQWPAGGLTQGRDGNLYGTATYGGANNQGTVFKMALDGTVTTLYSFCPSYPCSDGATPSGKLVQGADGNFYGTTTALDLHATIFKITPQGTLTTLHTFTNSDDGSPSNLVLASDGNFYGTTSGEGTFPSGTVFRIAPDGTFTTIYNFPTDYDGVRAPNGELVQGTDGNLYGAAGAGAYENGVLFKVTLGGDLTPLHNFNYDKGEGYSPGALVQAADGNFYGVTPLTAFRLLGTSYHLSVTSTGSGAITTADGLINCGNACFGQYQPGDVVNLTATPAGNWVFGSWTGCDSTQGNVCTVKMDRDRQVAVSFVALHDVNVNFGGYGSISSTDGHIDCPTKACSYWYLDGTPVVLNATPDPGWALNAWGGCDSSQGTTCWLTADRDRYIFVSFLPGYVLSVQKSGNGLITTSDGDINCGATCNYSYVAGESVTLTASPDQNWVFGAWTGCDQVYGLQCTVTMNSARTVIATFVPPAQLSVSTSGSGTVKSSDGYINCGSSCSHTYVNGTMVILTASPGPGWGLAGWTGCDLGDANVCRIAMNKNRTVTATFKVLYSLTVANGGNGTISSTDGHIYCGTVCSYPYVDGTLITLGATPAPGYTFTGWTGCDQMNGSYCSVTMTSAKNVIATFTTAGVSLTSLTFKPTYVKGGQLSVGTLMLNAPAPPGGVTVALSSDHPTVVHPPSFVFIPGGKSTFSFAVNTFPVKSNTTVTITATAGDSHVGGALTVGTTSLPPSIK